LLKIILLLIYIKKFKKSKERCLDEQINMMKMNKNIIMQDESNSSHIYVTHDDIYNAFSTNLQSQSLILVKLNQTVQIEVPEPMYIYNNSSVKQKYQISLKSSSEPIDAYLLQDQIKVEIFYLIFSF
jgi:hypothetical protein